MPPEPRGRSASVNTLFAAPFRRFFRTQSAPPTSPVNCMAAMESLVQMSGDTSTDFVAEPSSDTAAVQPARTSVDTPCDDALPPWLDALRQLALEAATEVPYLDNSILDRYPSHQESFRLYRDCIRYLEGRYPVASLACSVPEDLQETPLRDLPACFGTLVNLIADSVVIVGHPNQDASEQLLTSILPTLPRPHALRAIVIAAILTTKYSLGHNTEGCQASHILCTLLSPSPRAHQPTESDYYQGLFLDCLTHHLKDFWSARLCKTASPMPYSLESCEELARPGLLPTSDLIVNMDDLPVEIDGDLVWSIGFPFDIPWPPLGSRRDESEYDYPFCPSPSIYASLRRPKGTVYTLQNDAALWLSAMTFGLLEAITQMRIPQSILLVPGTNGEEAVIDGPRVLQIIVLWLARKNRGHGDRQQHLEHGREVAQLLRRALRALTDEFGLKTESIFAYAGIPKDKEMNIRYSIAHLLVILWRVMANDRLTGWGSLLETTGAITYFWGGLHCWNTEFSLHDWYEKRMLDAGWCPNVKSFLMRARDSTSLAALIPHLIRLGPYVRTELGEHADCSKYACALHTVVDTGAYKHRHARPSCECDNVKPPLDGVLQLLDNGVVPVVVYDGSDLRVVPAQENGYIAISHVWSEGMGSTTDVGLPICLVEHISDLAKSLLPEHDGAFWMDSLCVPSAREQRKKAIRLMADTYRDAAKVLVIDDSIRTLCHSELTILPEILLRVATSAWVRRVWTLQEGILARELYFEFVDGAVDCAEFVVPGGLLDLVPVLSFRTGFEKPRDLRVWRPPLLLLVSLLQGRTTTKDEDELIAISGLLPLHVKIDKLLAEGHGPNLAERRMKRFLLELRVIPLLVPFDSSPRSTLSGFTWAPYMLSMGHWVNWSDDDPGYGICTEEGLVGRYHSALLDKPITMPQADLESQTRGVLVLHPQSKTFHRLQLCERTGGASSPDWDLYAFDALLFVREGMGSFASTISLGPCIGVKRLSVGAVTPGSIEANGASHEHAIAVEYVVRCGLIRESTPTTQEILELWGTRHVPAARLGDLQDVWVRLS
ncbi:hypothetical protein GY45DRAFT_1285747 [Cubamyces sp. BRFM 1775]|nr:hypothetical protein GY45DRAFT_1285747 [Cubamyces sp. BRFM 1775]